MESVRQEYYRLIAEHPEPEKLQFGEWNVHGYKHVPFDRLYQYIELETGERNLGFSPFYRKAHEIAEQITDENELEKLQELEEAGQKEGEDTLQAAREIIEFYEHHMQLIIIDLEIELGK